MQIITNHSDIKIVHTQIEEMSIESVDATWKEHGSYLTIFNDTFALDCFIGDYVKRKIVCV